MRYKIAYHQIQNYKQTFKITYLPQLSLLLRRRVQKLRSMINKFFIFLLKDTFAYVSKNKLRLIW